MFSCMNEQPERAKSCFFKGVSPCRTMISQYICNEHAELFGLTYELADYTDANNDTWSKIVTYVCSTANFHLPLFMNRDGQILVNEIHAFGLTIANNYPNINRQEFENRIACLMGINAFDSKCGTLGGWLDDESSAVIVQNGDTVSKIPMLPQLHRILLHYTSPSITKNPTTGDITYLLPSLSLEYDANNPSITTFHFIIPNKQIVLKRTSRPNSVATPLVVNAIRTQQLNAQPKTFKPIINLADLC